MRMGMGRSTCSADGCVCPREAKRRKRGRRRKKGGGLKVKAVS